MKLPIDDLYQRVPASGLVAAQFVLGAVASERVPWWAAQWLADGHDGVALRELAGLDGRDTRAVLDVLPAALANMSVVIPDSAVAAASVMFEHFARDYLSGVVGERWVAQAVDRTIAMAGYADDVIDLPLGQLYLYDESWTDGRDGSASQLRDDVRAACQAQLALESA